ncbi:MAG: hypothetical protein CO030_00765 [Candidatus Magasanikbacteria bacterium CG_4_9_14_0_2_um_filter_42_11]|uniref:GIY-YIG domain-containing protein n=1 Tax=Candidatus Magasanikbacteria bacterium CG_4_9_14_0_2_um_filter_42_11 TaxID=1974643 RepID=A0A2M8FAV0_9BACT|nr:MAG: hypothetical protein CO030_00765 [Candidatus Magasanikbacteria bacterium CG_4_9_14_0_2_um_filter_42_11]
MTPQRGGELDPGEIKSGPSRNSMHYIYFLWSESLQKIYIGETPHVQTRLAYHNSGKQRYTKAGIPWRVIGYIPFSTKYKAKVEEKRLKKCKNRNYYRWYLRQNGKKFEEA